MPNRSPHIKALWLSLCLVLSLLAAACASDATTPETGSTTAAPATVTSSTADNTAATTSTTTTASAALAPEPAIVAAANPLATDAGALVLEQGGSAIDAAIAIQAVLGLVEPQSSGLAGGAFMLYFDAASGTITAYDGREEAPASTTPQLLLDDSGEPLGFFDAVNSGRSVGVPGVVAMLSMAHDDHGVADWSSNFDEAQRLATDGFAVSPRLSAAITQRVAIGTSPAFDALFLGDDSEPPAVGDLFSNTDYAATLQAVAEDWRAFYSGDIAAAISDAATAEPRGGGLTVGDFERYEARRLDALCQPYREYRVCGAPPPTSGGVAVLSFLGQLDQFDMAAFGPTTDGWHHFIEAGRRAYADRDLYVADDRFVDVPASQLLDPDYLAERAATIEPDGASATVDAGVIEGFEIGADATEEASGTSHFVVRDQAGNVVSMTTSVEFVLGSGRVAGGMVLNNQLTDFSFSPTDEAGDPVANAPDAGKRPRSSMAPTLVLDAEGNVVYAVGSPGGSAIISYVAKTLVGVLDWGLDPAAAIALPNVVPSGPTIRVEDGADADLVAALESLGHTMASGASENSGLHVLHITPGGAVTGAADPRREGTVATID